MPADQRFEVTLPDDMQTGVFAQFASIWTLQDHIVLDFAVISQPPQAAQDLETGADFVRIPTRIVSRVRIPPQQAWELLRGLNEQFTLWEQNQAQAQGHSTPPPDPS